MCLSVLLAIEDHIHIHTHPTSHTHIHARAHTHLSLGLRTYPREETFALRVEPGQVGCDSKKILRPCKRPPSVILQPENRLLLKEVGPAGEGRVSVMEQLCDEVSAAQEHASLRLSARPATPSLSDGSFVRYCDNHSAA